MARLGPDPVIHPECEITAATFGRFVEIGRGSRIAQAELKPRLPAELAARLMAMAWWDWPHEVLRARLDDFRRMPAAAFVEKYG